MPTASAAKPPVIVHRKVLPDVLMVSLLVGGSRDRATVPGITKGRAVVLQPRFTPWLDRGLCSLNAKGRSIAARRSARVTRAAHLPAGLATKAYWTGRCCAGLGLKRGARHLQTCAIESADGPARQTKESSLGGIIPPLGDSRSGVKASSVAIRTVGSCQRVAVG